jgi:hypothetical protein
VTAGVARRRAPGPALEAAMIATMRTSLFVSALVALAGPAWAQGTATITFQCAYDASDKKVHITGVNPNPVDRQCSATCTYTNKEKQTATMSCENATVLKGGKKVFFCDGSPKGTAPYADFKVTGNCPTRGSSLSDADKKLVETALKADEARKAEEAKRFEELKKAEEAKKAAEAKKAEDAKKTAVAGLPVVNGKPMTYGCVYNASNKRLEIQVTNPNGVDKKCDLACSYEASDKKADKIACSGVGVFKSASKLVVCADQARGPAPYTKLAATGTCN